MNNVIDYNNVVNLIATDMKQKNIVQQIVNQEKIKNKSLCLMFAYNGNGKTRISREFCKKEGEYLCFNSFLEDCLVWNNSLDDNLNIVLEFKDSRIKSYIYDQGIDSRVVELFHNFADKRIEPEFNFDLGYIRFYIHDSENKESIKISRGEEMIFKWSLFYVVLESAMEQIAENIEDSEFSNLKYIIIDDPVSSLDDNNIIQVANQIFEIIEGYHENKKLQFLITTHHPLFFNVLFNLINKDKNIRKISKIKYLQRNIDKYTYKKIDNDSPFGYHLLLKNEIEEAINTNRLYRNHFNMFRVLLEKTANFLGYNNYVDCINISSNIKKEFIRCINLYSHGNLSDLEFSELNNDEKNMFIEAFNNFKIDYKWSDKK